MKIRAWEAVAAVFGILLALLYVFTGAVLIGIGIGAGVAAGVAARLRPLEAIGVAGGHARRQGQLEAAKAVSLTVAMLTTVALLVTAGLAGWSKEPVGFVAVLALFGLEVMLLIEARRSGDSVLDWLKGAESEEAVERELRRLPSDSWFVSHNWLRQWGGNIDHIAIGPTGAFAIETKSRPYRGKDIAQALGGAMALREITGIGWVTAVVCVPGDQAPEKRGPVWVVGRDQISLWLRDAREHRGRPIDVAAVRSTFAAAVVPS